MVKKFDELDKTIVTSMRNGKGSIILEKMPIILNHMKMYARITIKKDCSIGVHSHTGDEEIVTVISGKGILNINNKKIDFLPGMINVTKENENHSIENLNDEDLVLIAVINEI